MSEPDWIVEVDIPTDRPWFYRATAAKLTQVLGAFAILGHKILNVREDI